jgi:hypothetical protein
MKNLSPPLPAIYLRIQVATFNSTEIVVRVIILSTKQFLTDKEEVDEVITR